MAAAATEALLLASTQFFFEKETTLLSPYISFVPDARISTSPRVEEEKKEIQLTECGQCSSVGFAAVLPPKKKTPPLQVNTIRIYICVPCVCLFE